MFFDSWQGILRVLVMAPLTYLALLVILRGAGKRTLSKFNAFDLVVTVALGSTLATIILSKDVAFLEGVLALALLAGLQFLISWCSVRVPFVEKLVKAEPTLLVYRQTYLRDSMRRVRITDAEVHAALRNKGTSLEDVEALVLETDGSISVVKKMPKGGSSDFLAGLEPDPETLDESQDV
jgi:uncharacterized membrane protein YcaP (DUF421 family)